MIDSDTHPVGVERHTSCDVDKPRKIVKKQRKYDESYISFGFINANDNPQCVMCSKILPNSSMAPAKLRRYLESVHQEFKDKNMEFFKRKRDELLKVQKFMFDSSHTVNENATEASFLVSYQIVKAGEAHTIGETLIKPCAINMARCMLNEKSAKEINKIPLSNDTVSRRIKELAGNVTTELIWRLKSSNFALQMDESTDVAGLAISLVLVRYQHEKSMAEDLLLCKSLPTNTTGAEIFNMQNSYFEENNIPWENCINICTDGAKSMVGKTAGAVARIKQVAKNCTSSHCVIHRQALVSKKMPIDLKNTLDEVVKIINFIKSRPLNNRVFKILCDDMGSLHSSLLLHTEVRWLSRGKILVRFFELRDEVRVFLLDHHFDLKNRLSDQEWFFKVAYLADIFSKINEVNLALQAKQVNIFNANDKLLALNRKLQFWTSCIRRRDLDCFPTLHDFLEQVGTEITNKQYEQIVQHLEGLVDSITQYFPNEEREKLENDLWVRNPFNITEKPTSFSTSEYENFIEMVSDTTMQSIYKELPLVDFWCSLKDEYQLL
ncbi:zinc finger BED domain-containing protein 5-like [Photinus pyralis]|uniref:zinc finger BED domain-containing protein 5-like n=1 Tax=Photinus pyralis TaxID=7054 RepID=UPI0012677271|nr:zinc finger BED domain-containing protein 5-like [Photinus pyralis]